jgi:hypothetical protein
LHEIGHAFGLCSRQINEFRDLLDGTVFTGPAGLAVYEEESGLAGPLRVVGERNGFFDAHFADNSFQSRIFPFGSPNRVGTVPMEDFQDLLMEGITTVGGTTGHYEITKLEVAALSDIGWEVIDGELPPAREIPLRIDASNEGGIRLIFDSEEGAVYFVQTSLDGWNWVNVQPALPSEGLEADWVDGEEGYFDSYGPATDSERKYYRVLRP